MAPPDPKTVLHRYLQTAREAMLWKLDGLSEYDIRRPLTPTGTNLLGLVKHLSGVEIGYFGDTFQRPYASTPSWMTGEAEDNVDMWATPDESRDQVIELYRGVWAHSDATIRELPLDSTATVRHWPPERREITLHQILVHVVAETHRHAGHADIVRELIDGTAGMRVDASNLPDADTGWWVEYRERVEQAARAAAER